MITRMHDWLANKVWIVPHCTIAVLEMEFSIGIHIWHKARIEN